MRSRRTLTSEATLVQLETRIRGGYSTRRSASAVTVLTLHRAATRKWSCSVARTSCSGNTQRERPCTTSRHRKLLTSLHQQLIPSRSQSCLTSAPSVTTVSRAGSQKVYLIEVAGSYNVTRGTTRQHPFHTTATRLQHMTLKVLTTRHSPESRQAAHRRWYRPVQGVHICTERPVAWTTTED